jgi:hypothetical protein
MSEGHDERGWRIFCLFQLRGRGRYYAGRQVRAAAGVGGGGGYHGRIADFDGLPEIGENTAILSTTQTYLLSPFELMQNRRRNPTGTMSPVG